MKGYGQFCPVAKAAEILTERWTPLVLRELLSGSHRFNEIRRGVPLMSPSLLSQRLRTLEETGVIRRRDGDGRTKEYHLTPAGRELRPLIEQLGVWGHRWAQREVAEEDLDPALLMWDIRRRITPGDHPERRVIRFAFTDVPANKASWWLVLEAATVDLCLVDPGYEVDLVVTTTVRLMTRVWLGHTDLGDVLGTPEFDVFGPSHLARAFPSWLELSLFAGVERP